MAIADLLKKVLFGQGGNPIYGPPDPSASQNPQEIPSPAQLGPAQPSQSGQIAQTMAQQPPAQSSASQPSFSAQPQPSTAPASAAAPMPSSAPPSSSIASTMAKQPPVDNSQTSATSLPSVSPQNAPIAQAPQPFHHGTLAKIFLTLGQVLGNPYAMEIGRRDMARNQQVAEYERDQPVMQYEANTAAQKNRADLAKTEAQTHLDQVNATIAAQNLPLQEAVGKHYETLLKTWQDKGVPDFDTYAQTYLQGLPPVMARMLAPHLDAIKQTPQTGKGYSINMQDDRPVSVQIYGQTYMPDAKTGKFGPEVPPQAVQDFAASQKAHTSSQKEKVDVATAEGQARANIEAAMARGSNAALASVPPHLIGPATDAATKAGQDYAQAQSVSQRLSAMVDAAKKGNVVSYQLIPEEGALQMVTSQGIHRINMAEIQNYGGGSAWQKLQGHIGKQLSGKSIPDSVLDDMVEMQRIQAKGARSKYENSLKTINQNYGSTFKAVDMERGGNQGGGQEAPKGATHTGIGSADKKKHWLDAKGKDLGVAE